ncbi:hypothetical protein NDU88_011455 [Pleurodeles waltl]|uniref:Uncharacterized protein n=1 Tax=Pleurodeles waltl TaxID=8319 RepID=A0AAV7Q391_PLEWA|nr:hypothetical protein NDU88_011455 [Pleurodeles waltl]
MGGAGDAVTGPGSTGAEHVAEEEEGHNGVVNACTVWYMPVDEKHPLRRGARVGIGLVSPPLVYRPQWWTPYAHIPEHIGDGFAAMNPLTRTKWLQRGPLAP